MNKYVQGKYRSEGWPSQYNKMRCLVSKLNYLKDLEYSDLELSHQELEVLDSKVKELTTAIHSWWENKLDKMEHIPYD